VRFGLTSKGVGEAGESPGKDSRRFEVDIHISRCAQTQAPHIHFIRRHSEP
jgi:hypothetical protein